MEPKQICCCDQACLISAFRHDPWFIAQNLESDEQIVYTMDMNNYNNPQQHHHYHECRINELRGRRIRACFHGWVILSNHPDNVLWSLWNPLTNKLIRLPPLKIYQGEKRSHECCLSSPPGDQDSVFLLTTVEMSSIVFCRLDAGRKRKRLKWTEMSYAKQLESVISCPTCYNGKVYAMTFGWESSVIEVDILVKEKEVVISLLPFVDLPNTVYKLRPPFFHTYNWSDHFLKGSSELFYIVVSYKTETRIDYVYLYKLDMTSMIWEEMVDLKDAILSLHISIDYPTCYYYTTTTNSCAGGFVHVDIAGDESDKIIFSFNPKDRTISISSMPSCLVTYKALAMIEWMPSSQLVEYYCKLEADKLEEDYNTQKKIKVAKQHHHDHVDVTTSEYSHLLSIPIHILEMIMEDYCMGIEYIKFRATCKRCYLAAPLIQWSTKKKRLQTYSLLSPWLMVLEDNYRGGVITFTDPLHGDRYFIKKPQKLMDNYYQIYCSRFGWLLMYQMNGPMLFYNPFTSDTREIPQAPILQSLCFSAPPTSPDCMLVGLTNHEQWHVLIHLVSRDTTWHFFPLNFGNDDPFSYRFPTFSGRDVYAFMCSNNNKKGVDVFRDMTEALDYSWEEFVDQVPTATSPTHEQYFMSMCDQRILLVILAGKYGESVEVFQLNGSGEEWEKIDTLGKHMIYVSDTSCICLEAKLPEMENKIYFPILLHDQQDTTNKIVFYSLETCRYHTFDDDKNIREKFGVDLFGTKQHCCPHTWIEPNWS